MGYKCMTCSDAVQCYLNFLGKSFNLLLHFIQLATVFERYDTQELGNCKKNIVNFLCSNFFFDSIKLILLIFKKNYSIFPCIRV